MSTAQPQSAAPTTQTFTLFTWLAVALSGVGVIGSLYLSIDMGLKACPLCFYQRTFIMAVLGVLLAGWMTGTTPGPLLSFLSTPLAAGGLVIAVYHVGLEATGALECPRGMAGIGSAPQQSLVVFLALIGVLAADIWPHKRLVFPAAACVILGGALAFGAIRSVPSTVVPNYDLPVDQDGCRKAKTKDAAELR